MGSALFAMPLAKDKVDEARALVKEMQEKHFDGFEDRARRVGYYRERMFLQETPEGGLLLVYLEMDGDDLGQLAARIQADDSEFNRWWNPKYLGLFHAPPSPSEPLIVWDDPQR